MAIARWLARFQKPPRDAVARERLAALVRAELPLNPPPDVTISEIDCTDPACAGLETVILILAAQEPACLIRIARPIAMIGAEELRAAIMTSIGAQVPLRM